MDEIAFSEHSANGDVTVSCIDDSVTDVIDQTPSDLPNQPSDSKTLSDSSMTSHLVSSDDLQEERKPPETTRADDNAILSSPKSPKQMILFAVELMEAETEKLRDMNAQLAQELGQLRAENDTLRRELKRSHEEHDETKQQLTTESKRLRAELEHVVEENRKSQQVSVQRCTEAERRIGELTNQLEKEKEGQKRLELELEKNRREHVGISESVDNLSGTQQPQQKQSYAMTSSVRDVHATQPSTSGFTEGARTRLGRSSVVDDDSQDRFLELALEVKSLRSERQALRVAGERLERNSGQLVEEIVRLKTIIEDRETELKREAVRHGLLTRQFNSLLDENERLKMRHNVRTYSMSNLLTTSADVDGNGSTSSATAATTTTLSQSANIKGASLSRSITWSSSLHGDGSTAFRRSLSPSAQDSGQAFATIEQHKSPIRRAKQSHQRMLRGTNRSPTALVLPVTAGNSVIEHSSLQETNSLEQTKKVLHNETERRQNPPLNSRSLQSRPHIQTSSSNRNGGTAADGEASPSYREPPSGRSAAVFDRLHAGRHGCKAEVVRQQQATERQQRQTAPVKQQALHIQSVSSATTTSRFVRSADAPAGTTTTTTTPLFLSTRIDAAIDGVDTDFSSPSSTDSVSTDATLPAIGRSMKSFVKSLQMAAKQDLRRPPNS